MKHLLKIITVFILSFSVTSCNLGGVSPQETFDVLGLSLNKIPYKFSQHFGEIGAQHKNGSLTYVSQDNQVHKGVSVEEYVKNMYPHLLKKDIEAIKNLTVDDETKPIQEATLDVFNYTQQVYETDLLRIAKMIDEGKSDAEIDAAIEELQNTKGDIIDEKFNKAHDLAFGYADKHGIKYEILDYPK